MAHLLASKEAFASSLLLRLRVSSLSFLFLEFSSFSTSIISFFRASLSSYNDFE